MFCKQIKLLNKIITSISEKIPFSNVEKTMFQGSFSTNELHKIKKKERINLLKYAIHFFLIFSLGSPLKNEK